MKTSLSWLLVFSLISVAILAVVLEMASAVISWVPEGQRRENRGPRLMTWEGGGAYQQAACRQRQTSENIGLHWVFKWLLIKTQNSVPFSPTSLFFCMLLSANSWKIQYYQFQGEVTVMNSWGSHWLGLPCVLWSPFLKGSNLPFTRKAWVYELAESLIR